MSNLRFCIPTCIKNEGPFIIEWVAYNRSIGVENFLIFTNDCDDYSHEILDYLDELGIVRHIPNPTMMMQSTQHHKTALWYAPYHKEFQQADYIIISDVDEFIVSTIGDGSVQDLLEGLGRPDVLSLSELIFGFGGVIEYKDEFVTEQFRKSRIRTGEGEGGRKGVKSIVKRSSKVEEYSNHRPVLTEEARSGSVWLDGSGNSMPPRFKRVHKRGIESTHRMEKAWLNHYTLRSAESLLTKFERGDAVRNNRLGPQYYRDRNGDDAYNFEILPRLENFKNEYERLMRDNKLRDLHNLSVEKHMEKIERLKLDPDYEELWKEILIEAQNDKGA